MTHSNSDALAEAPSLNEPAREPEASGDGDQQREALRDLMALATECATTESEVERRLNVTLEDAKKELTRLKWGVEQRFNSQQEATRQEHKNRLAEAQNLFGVDAEKLEELNEAARRRIESANEPIERKLKEKLDHALWIAESAFDIANNSVRADIKKARDEVDSLKAKIKSLEERAAAVLQLFGGKLPTAVSPLPPVPAAGNAGADMRSHIEAAAERLGRLEALAGSGMMGSMKRMLKKQKAAEEYAPLHQEIEAARAAIEGQVQAIARSEQARTQQALAERKAEVQRANDRMAPLVAKAGQSRESAIRTAKADYDQKLAKLQARRDQTIAAAEQWAATTLSEAEQRKDRELKNIEDRLTRDVDMARRKHRDASGELERRLAAGLSRAGGSINANGTLDGAFHPWTDPYWQNWTPPSSFPSAVRFGELKVDLKAFADRVPRDGDLKLKLPDPFAVPAAMPFPQCSSMLIDFDRDGRDQAVRILQTVMARLLTSLPPGRVRFTIIDPVGLGQSFAGFMHLADHDEALVGTRIWTESEQIDKRLVDMTEHMETVIQKYLRNEYETLDQYNMQAGELAEPYRFLVIADFPNAFQGDSFRRLSSIAASGARCGVHTLIARDNRVTLPDTLLDDLEHNSVTLSQDGDRFVWKDEVFRQFPLELDAAPSDEFLTRTLDVVGKGAKLAKRVELPFDTIAPPPDEFWTRSSADELVVPVGRMGATRLQSLRLGKGVAQHVLIAGKTGSGKSTLLHAMISNLAMWYSPDEVEFYLIDFKKGVEFKTYADNALPHARAIAVESDREFGLSVLQRLDGELIRRGEIFRKLGVQDMPSYRKVPGTAPMPRTLLVIDEFQEFFTEEDRIAQEANLLLDRLVRQGRAFGMHVLLGSQTIGGTSGLSRSTIGQMAVRIALMTSEADSQLILGDNNSAARLLTRPGEAIYNDQGGLVEANSPFQVAYLSDAKRDVYLEKVRGKAGPHRELPIVFEGNAAADITKNQQLLALLNAPNWKEGVLSPWAWIGDPVAIKEPTAVVFRRQSGANVLIIGQQDESAMAMMVDSMIAIGAQQPPAGASFYILDGSPADSPTVDVFPRMKDVLPHPVKLVEFRAIGEVLAELNTEMTRRRDSETPDPSIFVVIYGLQRYRALRKTDDFSFSSSSEDKGPAPDKLFSDLFREGPAVGIHLIVWADTPASIDRTLDRTALREFDNRVLFQMSATDSSNLIDSPAGNKLGTNRALVFSEEQGVMEKFRPYALPDKEWLEMVKGRLSSRPGAKASA